ncbi:hypothetical protein ABU614_15640 [Lysobacter firmicutimachus]|uniref:Lipoprotein n=1 Tax=Lysobacter firmicutimachus TaxID=1792846 RepID=A0AAU8MQY6_9GAMM
MRKDAQANRRAPLPPPAFLRYSKVMDKVMPTTLRAVVLLVAACSASCTAVVGSGSTGVSAAECRAYYVHTYRLDGMDAAAVLGEEQLSKDSGTCAQSGMVTRRHLDCAMAARSVDALHACRAPNT